MKDYKNYINSFEDELYDYCEVIGESCSEKITHLSSLLKSQQRKELEKLVQVYQWGE